MKRITCLLFIVGLTGCENHTLTDGLPEEVAGCSLCHGDEDSPAPPLSLTGETDKSDVGVGAHRKHLKDGDIRAAISCQECHRVPASVESEGHVDPLPADITWGPLAAPGGLAPAWNRASKTCSGVYCHGATLEGGRYSEPVWTEGDGIYTSCYACHGFPPPEPHPDGILCNLCHSETVLDTGGIDVAGGHHIDGVVDAPAGACSACHGSAESPAPPPSTSGATDPTVTEVGAHELHLTDGAIRKAVACEECHLVPADPDDPMHIDDSPAEVVWGPLATADGQSPVWNRDENRCTSVYCHGVTLSGARDTEPVWTVQNDPDSRCALCHGVPPPAPHTFYANCTRCHPDTVDANDHIIVTGGFHINGTLDVLPMTCSHCHGDETSPAPPVDTRGNAATTEPGVGAHREHLGPSDWHRQVACSACHLVPGEINTDGHINNLLPAEITWGPLARRRGSDPSYDSGTTTCSGVYCHGEALQGTALNRQPDWTSVGTGQTACGGCHGLPPDGASHPQQNDCSTCHGCVVAEDNQTIRPENAHLHINGRVNFQSQGNCPPQ